MGDEMSRRWWEVGGKTSRMGRGVRGKISRRGWGLGEKISRRVGNKLSKWRRDRVSGVLDWISISCQGGSCSRSSGGRIV